MISIHHYYSTGNLPHFRWRKRRESQSGELGHLIFLGLKTLLSLRPATAALIGAVTFLKALSSWKLNVVSSAA